MRQFVVVAHEAPTAPEFSLDDLPGAGRLDLLARTVTAAFLRSHGLREDVRVHLALGPYTVHVDGRELQGLNPDERSTAALIRTALEQREEAIGHVAAESSPGVSISRRDLAATLDMATERGQLVQLHPEGDPAGERAPPEEPVFVLSDHRPFAADEQALLDERGATRLSLGPVAVHADHAVALAHNHCDTEGYERYR